MLGEYEAKIQWEVETARNFFEEEQIMTKKICGLGQPPRPHLLT
jgi:hypothetical protein